MWGRVLRQAGVVDPSLRRDYALQRWVVARFARAEYLAVRLLLPTALQPDVVAAVAFMHETDDRVDQGKAAERSAALAEWAVLVEKACTTGTSDLPVLRALAHTAERHPDMRARVGDFLDGAALEVAWEEFATEADFDRYVTGYSLPALMLTAGLLAPAGSPGPDEFISCCERLISAMQRLDFLEDLASDLRTGRLGIPVEALEDCGISRADLLPGRPRSPAVDRLIQTQADAAATALAAARPLEGTVSRANQPFVRALIGVQHHRLEAVRAAGAGLIERSSGPSAIGSLRVLARETAARRRYRG
ncbi:squalene/phytoene synthase family protein [Streptomyces sp. TRM72054]|uniref:phytoene/squalene synthase family protein n=1 Tax=Streptomyces sp. TRM72054 TaxID=2870562 RepID=UPI001C8B7FDC|nr:squalene/phytoene synthase family protein [Streptomyces sp. TRM72054]MBX9393733.1 squalene/phytoene synthase family protein [Streptomyces sp. TRM72054]